MREDIKVKWIEALRSGNYDQGFGQLKHTRRSAGNLFCCLGVLNEISDEVEPDTDDDNFATELTRRSLEIIGLERNEMIVLMNMNDGHNGVGYHSFSEISDYIEHNL